MLVAWSNLHVFYWRWSWGSHSAGATVRYRTRGDWSHWRVVLFQRNGRRIESVRDGRYRARRSLTLIEVTHWRTAPGTRERVGLKSYVRVKVSPGGRPVHPTREATP